MNTNSVHIALPNEADTERLAGDVAELLPDDSAGWSILLQGELGAGKSTLARAMLRRLGHEGPVPSPTYTLVEPYELGGLTIYHVDLYRINAEEELQYLGWSDWADGLLLVEWPERAAALLETADLKVELEYDGSGRSATLTAFSDRGRQLMAGLAPAYDRS